MEPDSTATGAASPSQDKQRVGVSKTPSPDRVRAGGRVPRTAKPTAREARGVELGVERQGDCYEAAAQYVALGFVDHGEVTLVHGTVDVGLPWLIGHGWVLVGKGRRQKVFDGAKGQFFTKASYYKALSAVEERTYSEDEARVQLVKTKNYGPWHETEGAYRDKYGELNLGRAFHEQTRRQFAEWQAQKGEAA